VGGFFMGGSQLNIGTFIARYWLEVLFGMLTALLGAGYGWAMKKVKDSRREQKVIKHGIQALLRDRIIQSYNHCQDKGCCPIYALENVHDMFREYKALDGNGTIAKLVEEMEDMPRENTNDKKEKRLS